MTKGELYKFIAEARNRIKELDPQKVDTQSRPITLINTYGYFSPEEPNNLVSVSINTSTDENTSSPELELGGYENDGRIFRRL